MLIGVCLFRMSARRSSPMIRNTLLWFVMLAVCLAVAGC